ncbi:hypothetical protein F4820DRAFT_463685 [Hypoxylon rubiginosum]|uniref:Uncharacterized protein n=1 Tax=Hypoxylon rubiginosum TaxID=110542 RepID=A0ACB9YUJ5_9PEZI|nr:hypothetical protein F4820DRAFT_463685 [Hypoxylon rubiginosum]
MASSLGISATTCNEVETHVLANHEPTHIDSIDVEISFSPNDVTSYLGQTPAGPQLLALVCTLVTAFNPFESAQVLAGLMKFFPMEEKKCTAEEIAPLISAMKGRCELSKFAECVVNCETMLTCVASARPGKAPGPEGVIKLIKMLYYLQNNTQPKLESVEISSSLCLPWIAAFIYWWFRDNDSTFGVFRYKVNNVHITLKFPADNSNPELVEIRELFQQGEYSITKFDLGRAENYGGLVPIKTYFSLMLHAFKIDQGQAYEAAIKAIPYALYYASKRLTMCSTGCVSDNDWGRPCDLATRLTAAKTNMEEHRRDFGVSSSRFEPFPERQAINEILRLVEGCEEQHMQPLDRKKEITILDVREVYEFLESETYDSDGNDWQRSFQPQSARLKSVEPNTIFVEQITHIVATILALSLFRDPENLLVRPEPFIWQSFDPEPSTVITAIRTVLNNEEACCDAMEWHRICRKLAGEYQEEQGQQRETIISCFSGQAVWPAITFEFEIPENDESYLRLIWCRGNMSYGSSGRTYSRVVGIDSHINPNDDSQGSLGEFKIKFDRESEGSRSRTLLCSMVRLSTNGADVVEANPCGVFKSLSSAERLRECPKGCGHSPRAPPGILSGTHAGTGDDSSTGPVTIYRTPEDLVLGSLHPGTVVIVHAGDDDRLRFFALATSVAAHIAVGQGVGQGACCACYVNFCEKFGIDILVL